MVTVGTNERKRELKEKAFPFDWSFWVFGIEKRKEQRLKKGRRARYFRDWRNKERREGLCFVCLKERCFSRELRKGRKGCNLYS